MIDGAIVRVMKARKHCDHNELVAQVTLQLRSTFAAQPRVIKRRIEDLIDREYLERSVGDKSDGVVTSYTYLA